MLSVEEALEKILSYVSPMAPVEVALPDALGLTLAEEVTSPLDLPPLDNSAMDGFAVRYETWPARGSTALSSCPSSATCRRARCRTATLSPDRPSAS